MTPIPLAALTVRCVRVTLPLLVLAMAHAQQPPAVEPPPPPTEIAPAPAAAAAAAAPGQDPQPAAKAAQQDPAAVAAAEAAKAKAAAEQEKQQHLQKIKQVKFDRRPTTMLRTWSSPATAGVVTADPPQPGQAETPPEGDGAEALETADVGPGAIVITTTGTAIPLLARGTVVGAPIALPVPSTDAPNAAPAEPADVPGADGAPATPAGKTKPDPFDSALKQWARDVTLGNWGAVKTFLASLDSKDEQKAAWEQLLNGLRNPPQQQPPQPGQPPAFFFNFDDVLGLCAADPLPRDDAAFTGLGAILQLALQRGLLAEPLLARLRSEAAAPKEQAVLARREIVKLLFAANLKVEAGEFLPAIAEATSSKDFEALNLLTQHFVARNQKDGKAEFLEQAWQALQALFAAPEVDRKQKDEALKSAVALAPRLQKELGKAWLDASFTRDVQRGMDIIASIGVAGADAARTPNGEVSFRQLTLQLQKTAVDALLRAAPERAAEWQLQLGILADNWLREAQSSYRLDSSTSFGPMMRRDRYGNFFYFDEEGNRQNGSQRAQAIPTADVLELRPDERWTKHLEAGMQPRLSMITAQLWLKVQEEGRAFPYIAALAATHPPQAKELVDEFLRVWTRNHDPNEGRHNYYFYGYESRADGIPLTRSKQERNLADLSHWVQELRKLPIPEPDQELLAKAFTTCHSSAEVYRLEAIETVFGSMQELKPSTLSALVEQMRQNLATVWRQPNVQEKARTRRKQQDIEAEVTRGYQVAHAVVDDGLAKHAGDWSLLLARATLAHDENDYRREIGNEVKYTERRLAAFADFAAAAAAYATVVPTLDRQHESTDVYEHWFYAALGSSDLQNVKSEHVPVLSEVRAIREHLLALPGDAAERHVDRFANTLFTRMGNLNPAVKMRYAQAGLDIVGDNKQAFEAKKLYDYYKDIVSEIQLQTRVDGSTTVSHGEPFGLFVEIRHTREIERESGGFGRYLRNQNDIGYSYNYGRPTENYRDKFADMAKQQLGEHFDVVSITFQNDSVHSRATEQYGWRVTPYAYLLLKPRGPQVDRVPSLRLDLDFLDTSGYAVLPIESPTLAIDASAEVAAARPVDHIEITQILDERQAKDGRLVLEVKATGHGLLPKLDELLDLRPDGFDTKNVEDSGAMVSRFDPDGATDAIQAERTWNVTFVAKPDLPARPRRFRFGTEKRDGITLLRQRYADADLVAADAEVELLAEYGTPRPLWPWLLLGGIGLALLIGLGLALSRRRPAAAAVGLQVPTQVTPFTVLGLLRQIRVGAGIDAATASELDAVIASIEAGYFAAGVASDAPDLRALATDWVDRAHRRARAG